MITTKAPDVDARLVLSVMEHFLGDTERVGFGKQFGTDDLDKGRADADAVFGFALRPIIAATLAIVKHPISDVGAELEAITAWSREMARPFGDEETIHRSRQLEGSAK